MLAISVILGVAACTNDGVNISDNDIEGFSFIASIDHTRTDMVNNDGVWQTVWSGDDKLLVTSDMGSFTFTNSQEEPARFVSTDVEASALRDATNIVITTQHENGSVVDSDAGKRGLSLMQEYDRFPESGKVSLAIQSAFLRLACDYDVTISTDAAIFSGINGRDYFEANITLKAGDDIWVAVAPLVEKTSITVVVEERDALFVEELTLKPRVIYNLGEIIPEITPEPEPEPEPEPTPTPESVDIYFVPNDEWRDSGAWFAAYLWEGNEELDVKLLDEDGDGIYSAAIPKSMTNIIFCRMNPAYSEFAWNYVWKQTVDLKVGVAPNNYYYITGADSGEWHSADYNPNPNPPTTELSKWAVAGTFNGWGDEVMFTTDVANIFVAQGLKLEDGAKFKIKGVGSWDVNYGGGITNLMPNMWMTGVDSGKNIAIAKSGTYDIYFDSKNEYIYLMEEGVDYTTATKQSVDGEESVSWGLCGTHNNWGNDGTKDIVLTWDPTIGLYVAYNATLTEEFKVRANNSWGNDYGSNKWVIVDDENGTQMTKSGGNCMVTPGTYDVYFDLSNKLIWVRTPGSAAPVN